MRFDLVQLTRHRLASWVHPAARGDAAVFDRHLSLVASHLLGGALSAIVFSAYFAWVGAIGSAALIACLCFLSQFAIARFLSRTGRIELAYFFAALNLTALIVLVASLSGGSSSFAVAWLALVPLEAALSTNRRALIGATVLAVAALAVLHVATIAGALPSLAELTTVPSTVALASYLGAAAYAGALVASVQQIHRNAERAIAESRESYRLIAENATDLITRHDDAGRIVFASLASRRLLGAEPERLIAEGLQPFLAECDRVRYEQAIARTLVNRVPASEEFAIERTIDGAPSRMWLELRCEPVPGAAGSPAASVIGVTRDITRRKAEAEEIARARDEAERTSRAKTAFLATMSHELRTPLNAIIGFSELLHRELLIKAREPKHADYCRTIHQSGEHLLSLVKDLLDVSKIESGKLSVVPEPFALGEVAQSAIETLRPLAMSKRIALVSDVPDGLPDLLADRRAVRQILINLVSNACKFTPSSGTVTVKARCAGARIEIVVADTGIGIAPEHMVRLGQPFYQVDTRYARQNEGAGLGLSIVRGLVELHRGEMTVESTLGRGTRFRILLSADAADADAPASAADAVDVTAKPELHPHAGEATRTPAEIIDIRSFRAAHETPAPGTVTLVRPAPERVAGRAS